MKPSLHEFCAYRTGLSVIGGGLATSALSLFVVFLLGIMTEGFEIMGFYYNYVIPIGAIAVGLAAGSGYGVASCFSGVKISGALLWVVVGLQIGAYFVAHYIEY